MKEHIKKMFLGIVALTCFTCFQRADYNLPLFAFAYFLWDYPQPNVLRRSHSHKSQGSTICFCSRGSSTSSGSSTGELPGVQTSIRVGVNLAVPPS